jgi:hypothetical protein
MATAQDTRARRAPAPRPQARRRPPPQPSEVRRERERQADAVLNLARATEPARPSPDTARAATLRRIRNELDFICSCAIVVRRALIEFHRMKAVTDTNLRRFLADYEKAGVYLLMPAVIESGEPQLLFDVAILKRNLVVKSARDVGANDVEQCCLGQKAGEHFAKSDVEPPLRGA